MTSGEGHNAWKKTPTRIYKVDWREAKELLLDLKIFYLHCHSHRTLSLVLFSFFFLKVSTLQNIMVNFQLKHFFPRQFTTTIF